MVSHHGTNLNAYIHITLFMLQLANFWKHLLDPNYDIHMLLLLLLLHSVHDMFPNKSYNHVVKKYYFILQTWQKVKPNKRIQKESQKGTHFKTHTNQTTWISSNSYLGCLSQHPTPSFQDKSEFWWLKKLTRHSSTLIARLTRFLHTLVPCLYVGTLQTWGWCNIRNVSCVYLVLTSVHVWVFTWSNGNLDVHSYRKISKSNQEIYRIKWARKKKILS